MTTTAEPEYVRIPVRLLHRVISTFYNECPLSEEDVEQHMEAVDELELCMNLRIDPELSTGRPGG